MNKRCFALLLIGLAVALSVFAEEKDPIATQKKARSDTIRYGTDAELISLITALESEKNISFDAELVELLEKETGTKFVETVLSYLSRQKKEGGEERALRILKNRDTEANSTIDSAIQYLSAMKYKKAASILRDILEAEDVRFGNAAARALGSCGDEADVEFLLSYEDKHTSSDALIGDIIYALGELQSRKATAYLTGILSDADAKTFKKIAALEALEKIKDGKALDPILGALKQQDANVRSYAVAALTSFTGAKAEEAIIESFRDSFYKVRIAASKAAGEKKIKKAVPYLQYRAERDEVPAVKIAAVEALGEIGNTEALDILSNIFSEKKTADQLRISASKALLEKAAEKQYASIIAAMELAKSEKKMPLYHGLAKVLSTVRSDSLETLSKKFLSSPDIVDKMYGLDLVILNRFKSESVKELVKGLEKGANPAMARKVKEALGE